MSVLGEEPLEGLKDIGLISGFCWGLDRLSWYQFGVSGFGFWA